MVSPGGGGVWGQRMGQAPEGELGQASRSQESGEQDPRSQGDAAALTTPKVEKIFSISSPSHDAHLGCEGVLDRSRTSVICPQLLHWYSKMGMV